MVPVTADAAVGASLPIPIRRAVATAAQARAVRERHLMPIARLQQCQVGFVMAVEAVVVAAVTAVAHDDIRMFLGDYQVLVRVIPQRRRLSLFMADVAVKIGQVLVGAFQVRIRSSHRGRTQEIGVDQRNRSQMQGMPRQVQEKQNRQDKEGGGQSC